MKVKIDSSSSTPRIDGDYGTLEYSEQSNKLFIKSRRRGVIQIGSDSTVSTETDPAFTAWLSTPPNISSFTNDSGYLTSFSESDPVYTSSSWHTTTNNSSNWDTTFSWGNHASAGYLTSITSGQVTAALGYTPYDATNPSGYITSSSLSSYVPTARTLTINGTTYDLTADRSWTISTGTTYTFSTGLTNIAGTITSNLSTGVSGGQSVVGGTSSGNNLTFSSTSNATKGKILFGTSAYDEVNNRLGIGLTSPSEKLDVRGNGIFGTTNKVWIIPDYAGSGEIAAGASIGGTGTGGFSIFPNYFGTSGTKFSLGYYNQSVWFSGLELANVSGGFGKLLLMKSGGSVGIGTVNPTAKLQIAAGTASAGTAPIKLTSGTNLTTPENGALEYDGTNLYFTTGGVRKTIQLI